MMHQPGNGSSSWQNLVGIMFNGDGEQTVLSTTKEHLPLHKLVHMHKDQNTFKGLKIRSPYKHSA